MSALLVAVPNAELLFALYASRIIRRIMEGAAPLYITDLSPYPSRSIEHIMEGFPRLSIRRIDNGWSISIYVGGDAMCRRWFSALHVMALASLFVGLGILSGTSQVFAQTPTITPVANGLDNPRGLAFGPDEDLYVAEAGRGGEAPCIQGPEGEVCYGPTGAITRIRGGTQQRILTGLPSIAAQEGPTAGGQATGPHDIVFGDVGPAYITIGLGTNPDARATFGEDGENFGRLMRFPLGGAPESAADLAAFEKASNPAGGPLDTNPYGALARNGGRVVADAGGNALLHVDADGQITTLAVFPTRQVEAPPFLGLPPGSTIPMEPVPTTVALGPDGAYYVGELTGFPFPVDGARVYRVVPGEDPAIFATGFTNIIDIAFAADGSLYVLEIAEDSLLAAQGGPPEGALVRVSPDGTTNTVVLDTGLIAPGGIAISPSGGIYLTNLSVAAGGGQVVRVDLCAAGSTTCQEPRPLTTPFTTALSGAAEVNAAGEPNQGDPDGRGWATVTLRHMTNEVCFVVSASGITLPAMMAHIHRGAIGTNGPVVVPITAPDAEGNASGCVTVNHELLMEIEANPANFYVNVHTSDYPPGAIRGQLDVPTLTTNLMGEAEVNAAGTRNQGDLDGTGTATVSLDQDANEICYVLSVADITLPASMAHIHEAPAGTNGPVRVPLNAPDAGGVASGCAEVDRALILAIKNNPWNYYVNVHTTDFPPGALRGQLGYRSYTAVLNGAEEVNNEGVRRQGDPDGMGTATVTLKPDEGEVCVVISVMGITLPAQAAHIHQAPRGRNGPVVVPLPAPGADGRADGCQGDVDPDLIDTIQANPQDFYVNVHTSDYPPGAVRGQLLLLPGTVNHLPLVFR
jgi:hypothetical protein